jgi:thymidylate synthase
LLWYLSRENNLDFISYYIGGYDNESEDKLTVHGGYGPRLFKQRGHDQVRNVVEMLTRQPSSRRAVIQLFNAEDISRRHREIPCTTTLQFLVRDGRVHMITTMRSNDAFVGLPHDVFCFVNPFLVARRCKNLEKSNEIVRDAFRSASPER